MNFNLNLSDEEVYSSVSLDLSALEKLDEITERLTMDALKESEPTASKPSISDHSSCRNIRDSQEPPIETTEEEMKYRLKLYSDSSKVLKEKIRCTACAVPLLKHVMKGNSLYFHPILQVLTCKSCRTFYGDGDFPLDDDNNDTYCRWCAQGGSLFCCSACNFVFCKPCVRRNFKHSMLEELEEEDWKCFVCNPEALWKQRAICWAVRQFVSKRPKSINKSESSDEESMNRRKRERSRGKDGRLRSSQRSSRKDSDDEKEELQKTERKRKNRDSDEGNNDSPAETRKRKGKTKKSENEESDEAQSRTKRKNKEKDKDSEVDDSDNAHSKNKDKKAIVKKTKECNDESDSAQFKIRKRKSKKKVKDSSEDSDEEKTKDEEKKKEDRGELTKDILDEIQKSAEKYVRQTTEDVEMDANKLALMKKSCLLLEKLAKETKLVTSTAHRKMHQLHSWISGKNASPRKQNATSPIKLTRMMASFRKILHSLKEHAEELDKRMSEAEEEWSNGMQGKSGRLEEEEVTVNGKEKETDEKCVREEEVTVNGKEKETEEECVREEEVTVNDKEKEMEEVHFGKESEKENRADSELNSETLNNTLDVSFDIENMPLGKSKSNNEDFSGLEELNETVNSEAETVLLEHNASKLVEVNEKNEEVKGEERVVNDSDDVNIGVDSNDDDDVVGRASDGSVGGDDVETEGEKVISESVDQDKCDEAMEVVKLDKITQDGEDSVAGVKSNASILSLDLFEDDESSNVNIPIPPSDSDDEETESMVPSISKNPLLADGSKTENVTIEDVDHKGKEKPVNTEVEEHKESSECVIKEESVGESSVGKEGRNEIKEGKIKPSKDDRDAKLEFLLDSLSSGESDVESKEKIGKGRKKKWGSTDSSESDSDSSSRKKTVTRKKRDSKFPTEKVNEAELISQFEDEKLKAGCLVRVVKLGKDEVESTPAESKSKKTQKKTEDDIEKDIKRLGNLRTLEKTKYKPDDSNDDSDSESDKRKRKLKPKKNDKSEKKIESSEEEGNLSDEAPHVSTDELEMELKTAPMKEDSKMDELAKKMLMESSGSDSNLSDQENEEKPKEKKKKAPATVKEEKDAEKGSDDDSDEKPSKKSWRRDKLLTAKLSETDSEEEEKKWKEKKKLQSDSDELETRSKNSKTRRRRLAGSSSDEIKLSSGNLSSDSSSSSIQAEVIKKRKRVPKSDSSESKSSESKTKKKQKRRRIKVVTSDSDSGEEKEKTSDAEDKDDSQNKGRKNIRKVLKGERLGEETKQAAKDEEERKKRIAERQRMYNVIFTDNRNLEVLDKLVLDFDPETKKELVTVHPKLVKKLKPHQAEGIKFMWDACFESLKRMETEKGSGCILAHCMGLGKTLQVVALVHTLLHNPKTKVHTVLVICPLNTVLNWVNEFRIWLKDLGSGNDVEVYELSKYKANIERMYQLKDWQSDGGVMVVGYDMYRNLLSGGRNKRKKVQETFMSTLADPGPDLVICDEGHLLKNIQSALSKAVNSIKTARRIVLTGTPLQNNLKEYHCMIQFVKPSLLGTHKEFLNRFVNPISNGQCADSTPHDVRVMKRRAHVLHKMLEGCVQRRDYAVLTPFLPPKHEYVICICLTELQSKLYSHYLENFAQRGGAGGGGTTLFNDFQNLQRIWTHPRVLKMSTEKEELRKIMQSDSEGSLKDFIDDDTDESDTTETTSESSDNKKKKRRKTRRACKQGNSSLSDSSEVVCLSDENKEKGENGKEDPVVPLEQRAWWETYIEPEDHDKIIHSGKLILLMSILQKCELIGDKVLVFSQSLYSLNLIEYFLEYIDSRPQEKSLDQSTQENSEVGTFNFVGSWERGIDYFRIDGSVSGENRSMWCKSFNREDNLRARLFLISTRAGGMGINLVGANRVILFDASWNPSSDLQSIFRIYRFGQKKPCYVYRFLAQGTMEEKIYNRQVTKLSLASRVLDEHQIERHFNFEDLQELYNYKPTDMSQRPTPSLPKDRLLAEMIQGYPDYIYNYHEHDSLLENIAEEELTEEERKAAWEEFENEKKEKLPENLLDGMGGGIVGGIPSQTFDEQMAAAIPQLMQAILKNHPNATQEQLSYELRLATRRLGQHFIQQQQQQQAMYNHMVSANQMQPSAPIFPSLGQLLQDNTALLQAQYGYQNYYHNPVYPSSSTAGNTIMYPTQLQNNVHYVADAVKKAPQQMPPITKATESMPPKAHSASEGNGGLPKLKIRADLMPAMSDDNDIIIESVKRRN